MEQSSADLHPSASSILSIFRPGARRRADKQKRFRTSVVSDDELDEDILASGQIVAHLRGSNVSVPAQQGVRDQHSYRSNIGLSVFPFFLRSLSFARLEGFSLKNLESHDEPIFYRFKIKASSRIIS